jgi:hypothetical protein
MAKKDTTIPSSCINKEPFVELDPNGKASILNYNLPQSTCFELKNYLKLRIEDKCFKPETFNPPRNNFWDVTANLASADIYQRLNDDILGVTDGGIISNSYYLRTDNLVENLEPETKGDMPEMQSQKKIAERQVLTQDNKSLLVDVKVGEVVNQVVKGRRPFLIRNLWGKPLLYFVSRPIKTQPTISIVLHNKVCSYLGDYGAGRTVKTFSLLPGEKTTISIRSYKHIEEFKKRAENVLDSFTETSTRELQKYTEELEQKSNIINSLSLGLKLEGGIDVGLFELANVGMNFGAEFQGSFTGNIGSQLTTFNSALDTHVTNSSNSREIEVNTETSSLQISGSEESIVRQLENINHSRVLNFVFRQLLQEYITITYLNDVSIVYSNGYPESKRVVKLADIDTLLKEVLIEDCVEDVRKGIIKLLCSVQDYEGTTTPFIECVEEEIQDCCSGDDPYFNKYIRKRKGLSQTYKGITVPGIIMDVRSRILRTDAVVVDALLGQGEALDCYNMHLQDEAVKKAQLDNIAYQQQINIIDGINNNQKKAELYKKVFTDCCDVPQVGCTCGCGGDCNCNENKSTTPENE